VPTALIRLRANVAIHRKAIPLDFYAFVLSLYIIIAYHFFALNGLLFNCSHFAVDGVLIVSPLWPFLDPYLLTSSCIVIQNDAVQYSRQSIELEGNQGSFIENIKEKTLLLCDMALERVCFIWNLQLYVSCEYDGVRQK
jgi:hypothetical protein